MFNIGLKYGRKVIWIGVSGDQIFLRIDEVFINFYVFVILEIFVSKYIIGNIYYK